MSEELVTLDEFKTEMTPEAYAEFLEHQKATAYTNEAVLRDGVPVDADEFVVSGAEILASVSVEV
jgi:hypothetical protein